MSDGIMSYMEEGITSLIKLNGKAPIEKNWVKWVDIEPSTHRIQELEDHLGNIGWAIPKNLIVLDCDTQGDAKAMELWLKENKLKYWHQVTAKGAHFVLKKAAELSVNNSTKVQFNHIQFDIRTYGGQIAVWPSKHPTGPEYTWVIWPTSDNPLSELPAEVVKGAEKETQESPSDTPRMVGTGSRNDILFKMGASMRGKGFSSEAITLALTEHNTKYCDPPLDDSELEIIINQVGKYDAGEISVSRSQTERPLNYDTSGRLSRFMNLAHQLKRCGQGRDKARDTLLKHTPDDSDREVVQSAVEIVFGEGDDLSDELIVHSPQASLSEYRQNLLKRSQFNEPELPTGFPKLDGLVWGIRRGQIFTVGARTGVGKTSLLMAIAHKLCMKQQRVLYISTETNYEGIFNRLIAFGAQVPTFDLEKGQLSPDDKQRFENYMHVFSAQSLFVCDVPEPSLLVVEKAIKKSQPDVVIMDHIQHTATTTDNRHGEISRFVKGLKNLAQTYKCGVLMASQLNRLAAGEMPTLIHLKECGTIEEESSAVLLLYKPQDSPQETDEQVLGILAKNRGPKGTLNFRFFKLYTKFVEE